MSRDCALVIVVSMSVARCKMRWDPPIAQLSSTHVIMVVYLPGRGYYGITGTICLIQNSHCYYGGAITLGCVLLFPLSFCVVITLGTLIPHSLVRYRADALQFSRTAKGAYSTGRTELLTFLQLNKMILNFSLVYSWCRERYAKFPADPTIQRQLHPVGWPSHRSYQP